MDGNESSVSVLCGDDSADYSIQENVSLIPYHTFSLPAKARYFCKISNKNALKALLKDTRFNTIPRLFLGEGSNTIFIQDFPGLVIQVSIKGKECIYQDENKVHVKAGAGENWHELVLYTLNHGWCGLENLSLIPGSAGAAPIQNIGAYGVEIKNVLHSLSVIDLFTGRESILNNKECGFSYRDSCFKHEYKNRYVIISITLELSKTPDLSLDYGGLGKALLEDHITKPSVMDLSRQICKLRRSKLPDPDKLANAGSFFKNPVVSSEEFSVLQEKFPEIKAYPVKEGGVKLAAGWLIESCGWKGRSIGGVSVYARQALVLTNSGMATGQTLMHVAESIRSDVRYKFNVFLEIEPMVY